MNLLRRLNVMWLPEREKTSAEETIKKKIKSSQVEDNLESSYQLCNWEKWVKTVHIWKSCWNFCIQAENSNDCQLNFLEIVTEDNEMTLSFAAKIIVTQELYICPKIIHVQEQ